MEVWYNGAQKGVPRLSVDGLWLDFITTTSMDARSGLFALLCCLRREQMNQSVRWHAQLNLIKAIVRLCSSIGQLQLSDYTKESINWTKHVIPRYVAFSPNTWEEKCGGNVVGFIYFFLFFYKCSLIAGAVPISTKGNRATDWPLYVTSNNKLRQHSRMMFSDSRDVTIP